MEVAKMRMGGGGLEHEMLENEIWCGVEKIGHMKAQAHKIDWLILYMYVYSLWYGHNS